MCLLLKASKLQCTCQTTQNLPVSLCVSIVHLQHRELISAGFSVVQTVDQPVFSVHHVNRTFRILVTSVENDQP